MKLATLVSLAKSEFHHYLISWWEVRGIFLSPFFVAQQTNPSLSLVVEVSSSLTDRHRHTHTHIRQDPSVRLISSSQRPQPTQHTTNRRDEHHAALSGIRTRYPSNRIVADRYLRQLGHQDRLVFVTFWTLAPSTVCTATIRMCIERKMDARSGVRILIRPPGCTLLIVINLRTCFKEGAMLQLIYTPVTHLLL